MEDYNLDEALKNIFDVNETNWKPNDKIPLITKEIEQLKLELKTYLNNSDYDLESINKEGRELCAESESLLEEMEACKSGIENGTMAEIIKSIENHDLLAAELKTVNFTIDIVNNVITCGRLLKAFEDGRESQSFPQAVEAAYELLQLVNNPAEGFNCLDIYSNFRHVATSNMGAILQSLFEEWHRMISWNVKAGNRKTVITITISTYEPLTTIEILRGLDKCKKLDEKISELSQFLLKEILDPIVHCDCTVYAETDELITVTIMHKQDFKPPYNDVITNLRLLFHYLSVKLNVEYDKDTTIMSKIGNQIYEEFSNVLVEDCLKETVPNNMIELQTYHRITSEIDDLQVFLTKLRIFPPEGHSILHYVKNIDALFAEKSSTYFLETARTIMFKDLSVPMSIGVESIPVNEQAKVASVDKNIGEAINVLEKTIPKSLFYFPRCMISKSAQELLDLLYLMMEQAVQCSDVVCKKLYVTTRLVFELYDAVVPYHHENYLQNIPQYVALFHNNCMYLAHNLQTFGDKWHILMEGRDLDYPISFVDLVPKLRELGYKYLTIHMQQQRKQILDNIRGSDLNCIVVKDILGDNAEAAIRQCLRQLQLLKNVWIGVFPINVFTRLMATLVNMFIDELIHRVCTVEDISMEMATQLTEMYTLVVQKVPLVFQQQSDVDTYVKPWIKLKELIFILGGSLKDIENHWNDGTGPLAVHFRTEELRNLIKALFQNTQFRANLLSKIK